MSSSLKITRRFTLGGRGSPSAPPSAARPLIAAPPSSSSAPARNVSAAGAAAAAAFDLSPVPPAKLEGTRASFPLSANRLITLAQELFATDTGVAEGADALLADDFRFEFPVISLPKDRYLAAVRSFELRSAFPNLDAHPYDWRVDKYEPNRVWFTTRVSATHAKDLKFGNVTLRATGKTVQGAPEVNSYLFNEEGKCTAFTGGYVVDRRVGNTKGLGAVFGIMAALGAPVPGTFAFSVASFVGRVVGFINKTLGAIGLGKK